MEKLKLSPDSPEGNEIHNGSKDNIVESKELAVSFGESVEELPMAIQEMVGISRLRRRKVISYPKFFYDQERECFEHRTKDLPGMEPRTRKEVLLSEKVERIWQFLTDGRFPSYKTWTHVMSGDWNNYDGQEMIDSFHKDERGIFQEFFPAKNLEDERGGRGFDFYEKTKDGRIVKMPWEKMMKMSQDKARKAQSIFNMDVMDRGGAWIANVDAPIFVFGGKSSLMRGYIESIKENSDTKKMLQLNGWNLDNPFDLITRKSPDFEKYKKFFDGDCDAIPKPKIDFPQDYLTGKNTFMTDATENPKKTTFKDMSIFDNLFTEINIKYYSGYPPVIPVVRHSDIKPLRWSHSELAILPKERDLEIVFFESE
jgi:hypothetical protein